jgi:S-adenosylmethionine decarboxylase
MKNLAPKIYRQRLVIEGLYTTKVDSNVLKKYLRSFSEKIGMTIVYGPIVKNLAGRVNSIHKGLEAILIWAESGVAVYTWEKQKFFTVDIYTCKKFDSKTAVKFTKEFFKAEQIVFKNV